MRHHITRRLALLTAAAALCGAGPADAAMFAFTGLATDAHPDLGLDPAELTLTGSFTWDDGAPVHSDYQTTFPDGRVATGRRYEDPAASLSLQFDGLTVTSTGPVILTVEDTGRGTTELKLLATQATDGGALGFDRVSMTFVLDGALATGPDLDLPELIGAIEPGSLAEISRPRPGDPFGWVYPEAVRFGLAAAPGQQPQDIVPEPASLALVALGAAALVRRRRA